LRFKCRKNGQKTAKTYNYRQKKLCGFPQGFDVTIKKAVSLSLNDA
jgi:hypothetical protein